LAYTLGDAARATGKSKPTIAKAIKTGRISAGRGEDGSYQIDPAELHRVYPVASEMSGNSLQHETPVATATSGGEVEKWRALATEREEVIRDLRIRLDAEAEERRRLTAILTDGRSRSGWLRRLFAGVKGRA
jgi:hypothetical protein